MSRLVRSFAALLVLMLINAGCGQNEPPWVDLPSSAEEAYVTSVKTYGGDHADRPFEIRVRSKNPPGHENIVLRASQCKNVWILPRQDYIYIFYDELILEGYSSNQFDASLPRPFLCDIRHKFCDNLMRTAVSASEPLSKVCSYF